MPREQKTKISIFLAFVFAVCYLLTLINFIRFEECQNHQFDERHVKIFSTMRIEWDDSIAASNLVKHKVSFAEAQTVFDDFLAATDNDPNHSFDEKRFINIGESSAGRLIVVSHTLEQNLLRIISARKPTRREIESYENGLDERRV